MLMIVGIFGLLFIGAAQAGSGCDGATIYNYKLLNKAEKDEVLQAHNGYRRMLTEGKVPGQPQGNVPPLSYEMGLEKTAAKVTNECEMNHILNNPQCEGQNLYKHCSSDFNRPINWTEAVKAWYDEYSIFGYPDQNNGDQIGHYTQLMWADTKSVGCRHIYYQKRGELHCHLYSCNYFPCGNIIGQAPYELGNGKKNPKKDNPGVDNTLNYQQTFQGEDDIKEQTFTVNKKDNSNKVQVSYHTVIRDENNNIIKEFKDNKVTNNNDFFSSFGNGFNNMFTDWNNGWNGFNNAVNGFFSNRWF